MYLLKLQTNMLFQLFTKYIKLKADNNNFKISFLVIELDC